MSLKDVSWDLAINIFTGIFNSMVDFILFIFPFHKNQ